MRDTLTPETRLRNLDSRAAQIVTEVEAMNTGEINTLSVHTPDSTDGDEDEEEECFNNPKWLEAELDETEKELNRLHHIIQGDGGVVTDPDED